MKRNVYHDKYKNKNFNKIYLFSFTSPTIRASYSSSYMKGVQPKSHLQPLGEAFRVPYHCSQHRITPAHPSALSMKTQDALRSLDYAENNALTRARAVSIDPRVNAIWGFPTDRACFSSGFANLRGMEGEKVVHAVALKLHKISTREFADGQLIS